MSGSTVLDLVLSVMLVSYAVGGYRQGLVRSAFSIGGFLAGAAGGLVLVPRILAALGRSPGQGISAGLPAIIIVLVAATIGQSFGAWLGHRLAGALGNGPVRAVDGAAGAIVHVVIAATVVWFVAATVRPALPAGLSSAVTGSKILRTVDTVVPDPVGRLFAGVRNVLDAGGFPRVFTGLAPEPINPVDPPQAAVANGPAIRRVSSSIVKVRGAAPACGRGQEGTGWVLADHRVVTNAHVVAGVSAPAVQVLGQGPLLPATVVLFDPDTDVAVLDVPELTAAPLVRGTPLVRGDSAVVAGFPLDGPFNVQPARVRAVLDARGEDIYGSGEVTRNIYSLAARVRPGNSGGPLLDAAGRVVGVVFARSVEDEQTGYALTLAEVADELAAGTRAAQPVSTGACA